MDPKSLPAFPCEWDYIDSNRERANGMSLRDYFAAKAMQAQLSNAHLLERYGPTDEDISGTAYALADAMLKAREA